MAHCWQCRRRVQLCGGYEAGRMWRLLLLVLCCGVPMAMLGRADPFVPKDKVAVLQDCLIAWNNISIPGWAPPWNCTQAQGLACALSGSIVSMSINNTAGSLPLSLGNLTDLTYLLLSPNQLSGDIPSTLSRLLGLVFLDLSASSASPGILSGTIPESLGRLKTLTFLGISHHKLSGSIPESFGGLLDLQVLDLHHNQLTGPIPESLLSLRSLNVLELGFNQLNGSIPASLGKLSNLTYLDLHYYQLSGSIPKSLLSIGSLKFLELGFNHLKWSIPASLEKLSNLTSLGLASNQLRGPIPKSLLSLRSLKFLELGLNQLNGSIPASLGKLSNLTSLGLAGNQLSGSIPESLGGLGSLKFLSLAGNLLNGTIPTSIGGLRNLSVLFLGINQLSGSIPESLGESGNLELLVLGINLLNGTIPTSIWGSRNLTYLSFESNQLTGSIPELLGGLKSLALLNSSSNRLSGSIPASLGELTSLVSLDMSNNTLEGNVSIGWQKMTQLQDLRLSMNNLTGELPFDLGNLVSLSTLALDSNHLSESIPESLWSLTALVSLNLSKNHFIGTIPTPLEGMISLASLDMSWNQLSGSVPESLGQLKKMSSLNLNNNQLTGSAPTSLALLTELGDLQLPDAMPCPSASCPAGESIARNQQFCWRCTPFCSQCAPLTDCVNKTKAINDLLQFQKDNTIPGTWTRIPALSFDGVEWDDGTCKPTSIVITNRAVTTTKNTTAFFSFRSTTLETGVVNLTSLIHASGSLKKLVLSRVSHKGGVPTEVEAFTQLEELDLSFNCLSGPVPMKLTSLQKLTRLDLGVYPATCIPIAASDLGLSEFSPIAELTGLRSLNLKGNKFQGVLPQVLQQFKDLQSLDLSSGNTFTGSIPESVSLLSNLSFLNLEGNSVDLPLPVGLATLPIEFLAIDIPQGQQAGCPNVTTPCPTRAVQGNSPFCTTYCPGFCGRCFSPPPPNPPPSPPPPPPSPPPPPPSPPSPAEQGLNSTEKGVIGGVAAALGLGAALVVFLIIRSRREMKDDVVQRGIQRFTLKELEKATNNFSKQAGNAGVTYEGFLPTGKVVAVRRDRGGGEYDDAAVRKEIKLLSFVHHRNLVELIGYCLHKRKLLLVYEVIQRGALADILTGNPEDLTWSRRLKIAVGVALGLDYLHTQISPIIIHGNLEAQNIFVTSDYEAKIGGFGGSGRNEGKERGEGSGGYLDPVRGTDGRLTTRSDVYSFGVVLLQLATGLPPVVNGRRMLEVVLLGIQEEGEMSMMAPSLLSELESRSNRKPTLNKVDERTVAVRGEGEIVEEVDGGEIAPAEGEQSTLSKSSFLRFLNIALKCCQSDTGKRPSMYSVAVQLESIQQPRGLGSQSRSMGSGLTDASVLDMPFPEYHVQERTHEWGVTELLALADDTADFPVQGT